MIGIGLVAVGGRPQLVTDPIDVSHLCPVIRQQVVSVATDRRLAKSWTEAEDAVIRACYREGVRARQIHERGLLPGRSLDGIKARVRNLGVTRRRP